MHRLLSEELLDFFTEMLNVGVGNAAAALEQLLGCPVEVRIPSVKVLSAVEAPMALEDPGQEVVGVKMRLVGDVPGAIFFILPVHAQTHLNRLLEKAIPGLSNLNLPKDLGAFAEVGNIVTGVYLAAIQKFCGLSLFHSVPAVARDMFQAVVDETLALLSRDAQKAILVINEFHLENVTTRTFLMIFFSTAAEAKLAEALQKAQAIYGMG